MLNPFTTLRIAWCPTDAQGNPADKSRPGWHAVQNANGSVVAKFSRSPADEKNVDISDGIQCAVAMVQPEAYVPSGWKTLAPPTSKKQHAPMTTYTATRCQYPTATLAPADAWEIRGGLCGNDSAPIAAYLDVNNEVELCGYNGATLAPVDCGTLPTTTYHFTAATDVVTLAPPPSLPAYLTATGDFFPDPSPTATVTVGIPMPTVAMPSSASQRTFGDGAWLGALVGVGALVLGLASWAGVNRIRDARTARREQA